MLCLICSYLSCDPGYHAGADESACVDHDECAEDNGGCNQVCSNLPGDHECSCLPGYKLSGDEATCQDTDECLMTLCNSNMALDHTLYQQYVPSLHPRTEKRHFYGH